MGLGARLAGREQQMAMPAMRAASMRAAAARSAQSGESSGMGGGGATPSRICTPSMSAATKQQAEGSSAVKVQTVASTLSSTFGAPAASSSASAS